MSKERDAVRESLRAIRSRQDACHEGARSICSKTGSGCRLDDCRFLKFKQRVRHCRKEKDVNLPESAEDLRAQVRESLRKVALNGKTCRLDSKLFRLKDKMTKAALSTADVESVLSESDECEPGNNVSLRYRKS